MTEESDGVKRKILDVLGEIEPVARIYECGAKERLARPACVAELTRDALRSRAGPVTFDASTNDRRDRQVMRTVIRSATGTLEYRHLPGRQEPLLIMPDAIAWAYGKGGWWRAAVAPLIRQIRRVVP